MKIISKFKDYYDNASGWYSNEPIFIREKKEIIFKNTKYHLITREYERFKEIVEILDKMPVFFNNSIFDCRSKKLIAFCGKAYPFYFIEINGSFNYYKDFCYSCKSVEKFLKQDERENKKRISKLNNYNSIYYHSGQLNYKTWEIFIENTNFNLSFNFFVEFKSPIFILEMLNRTEFKITINPSLKDYNFQSQINPYTTYQEIEMYLGNELVNQIDPDINITDELKRDAKGFDDWSFKRHKEESKKRRIK